MSDQSIPAVEYRNVPDWPAYRVGTDGSVWSRWRKGPGSRPDGPWKRMRPTRDREGYARVQLVDGYGRKHTRKVCSLVLTAFRGDRPAGQEARHLDGNSSNDALVNLAWGTPLENHATSAATERLQVVSGTAKSNSPPNKLQPSLAARGWPHNRPSLMSSASLVATSGNCGPALVSA